MINILPLKVSQVKFYFIGHCLFLSRSPSSICCALMTKQHSLRWCTAELMYKIKELERNAHELESPSLSMERSEYEHSIA